MAAFQFAFEVPARTVVRVRLEMPGVTTGKCVWLTCALTLDGDEASGCFVEFVAIGVLDLETVPVLRLGKEIDMTSKRKICQTKREQSDL